MPRQFLSCTSNLNVKMIICGYGNLLKELKTIDKDFSFIELHLQRPSRGHYQQTGNKQQNNGFVVVWNFCKILNNVRI